MDWMRNMYRNVYRIDETEDGFVIVNEHTGIHESEVYANRACAEEFMDELVNGYFSLVMA